MKKERIFITSTSSLEDGSSFSKKLKDMIEKLGLPYEKEFDGDLRDVVVALASETEGVVGMDDGVVIIELYNDCME